MAKGLVGDFTAGSIPKHLIRFTIPMLLGNLLQALYSTVDSFWVGRFLGPEALGAVSISGPIVFGLIALVMGITMATTVMVSQFAGAKRMDMVYKVVNNSTALLTLSGLAVSIFGIAFHRQILNLMNTPRDIFALSSSYLTIFLGGLVFMFLYNVLGAILRGLGDSRTPLLFLVYATLINIVLDPLMIFGVWPFPKMGVAGAALATDIAQAISAFLGFRYLRRVNRIPITINPANLSGHLTGLTIKIGLPAGIQQTLVALGGMTVMSIVNSFGKLVVAAYGAALRLEQFAFMPSMSFSLAVSSVVGQNLGAGKEERVHESVKWSTLLAGGSALFIGAILFAIPRPLLGMFTTDAGVLDHGTAYLRTVTISYVPLALMFTLNGVIRGAGDTVATMFTTLVGLWIVRIPLAKYLSSLPALGSRGIWMAIATSPVVGMMLSYIYYRTGLWRRKVLVRGESPQRDGVQ